MGDENGPGKGEKTEYTYQWSTGTESRTVQGLSAGTYSVGVTDSPGAPSGTVIQTPKEFEVEAKERTRETYFASIINPEGRVDGESALTFMDFIREQALVDATDENGEPVLNQETGQPEQVQTFPNLEAFKEQVCKELGVSLEAAATDPRVWELYSKILGNIRNALYLYGTENSENMALLHKCDDHISFLGGPEQVTEEQAANGVSPGLGIPPSEAEIASVVAETKTKLEKFFSAENTNLAVVLEQCTKLDNTTTRNHLNTIIARVVGPGISVTFDDTDLPPEESPISISEGGVVIYSKHRSVKDMPFDQTLPIILAEMIGTDEITPEYINGLMAPHKSVIGSKPVANEPAEDENPEAKEEGQGFLPLLFSIFGAKSEEEAMANAYAYYQQNLSEAGGMMGMIIDAIGPSNMMSFGQKAVSMIFDFCQSIKGMLGLSDNFNAVASNEEPSTTTKLQQNGQDITTTVGTNGTPDAPTQDRQRVANVTLPS